ncbi:hypothetical protein ACTHQF_06610 [Pedobacter sp. SAFR-022]
MTKNRKNEVEILKAEIASVKANRYMTPEEKAKKINHLRFLIDEK